MKIARFALKVAALALAIAALVCCVIGFWDSICELFYAFKEKASRKGCCCSKDDDEYIDWDAE